MTNKNSFRMVQHYYRLLLCTKKRTIFLFLIGSFLAIICLLNLLTDIDFSFLDQGQRQNKFTRSKHWHVFETIPNEDTRPNIGIFLAIDDQSSLPNYKTALDSVHCYAKFGNYSLQIVFLNDNTFNSDCTQTDKMFKRHCVAARLLVNYDWMLFIDADIGVINPEHRIEEWIDHEASIIFYDRFFNWEVTAGSYLVKNSHFSIRFLNTWANYEAKLPKSFHGTDNGAIHMVLMEELAPNAHHERNLCQKLWNQSQSYADLFAFEACARFVLGATRIWPGRIKILPKGLGWARDGWLTSTKWSSRDFLFHGWQEKKLESRQFGSWSNPFQESFNLSLCHMNDFSNWRWKPEFQAADDKIDQELDSYAKTIQREFWKKAGQIAKSV